MASLRSSVQGWESICVVVLSASQGGCSAFTGCHACRRSLVWVGLSSSGLLSFTMAAMSDVEEIRRATRAAYAKLERLMAVTDLFNAWESRWENGGLADMTDDMKAYGAELDKARHRYEELAMARANFKPGDAVALAAEPAASGAASVEEIGPADTDALLADVLAKQRTDQLLKMLPTREHSFKDKKTQAAQTSLVNQSERNDSVAGPVLEARQQLPAVGSEELELWSEILESKAPGASKRLKGAAEAVQKGATAVSAVATELVHASLYGWDAIEEAKQRHRGEKVTYKLLQTCRDACDKRKKSDKDDAESKRRRFDGTGKYARGRGRGGRGRGHWYTQQEFHDPSAFPMVPQQGQGGYAYGGYANTYAPNLQKPAWQGGRGAGGGRG